MLDVLIFDYIHYNFKQVWHVLMNPGWWSYKDWLLTSGRATVHQFGVGYLSKMSLFFIYFFKKRFKLSNRAVCSKMAACDREPNAHRPTLKDQQQTGLHHCE